MDDISSILEHLKNVPGFFYLYWLIIYMIGLSLAVNYVFIPAYRYVCLPIYLFFVAANSTMNKVSFLEKELRPNGGSSIRDAINAIKQKVYENDFLLKKNDSKQNILFNVIGSKGLAFFETDAHGECVSITPKYCELTNLTEEEVLGNNWILAIHPEDRDHVMAEWNSCISMKRVFDMKYRYLSHKNGMVTIVHSHATPIKVEGEPIGFLGYVEKLDV